MRIKSWGVLLLTLTLSGCFSSTEKTKKATVIIDKSTYKYAVEKIHPPITIKNHSKNKGDNQAKQGGTILITHDSLPVKAMIVKTFSKQHPGISFDTLPDEAIRAVQKGVVVYSDTLKNQGQVLVIKHKLGFYSTYAQAVNLRVSAGDKVKKGQIIALTGRKAFYFSMKKFKTPINPTKYLTR